MKILKKILSKGILKLQITENDDLWCLKDIIELGDLVKARTMRSIFITRGEEKLKVGKKPMTLKIQVEKIEFQEYTNKLRLTGKIVEGPDDIEIGSYHTIDTEVNGIITIEKDEWKKYQLEKIRKAEARTPKVLIVVVDTDQATFGLLEKRGVSVLSDIGNPHSYTYEEKCQEEFHRKVADELKKYSEKAESVILAGPGFTKEYIRDIIKRKYPNIDEKLFIDSVSSATKAGINEVVKKGTLEKIFKENEISKESKLIEEFFLHLKKDDRLAVYGTEEVENAELTGAIKILLVSEKNMRDPKIENLTKRVEEKSGEVEIISHNHELGNQFSRIGGLGAILRFRTS